MMIKAIPIVLIPLIFLSICSCDDSGFTVELIHRDSPLSPSYNPSSHPSQRLAGSLVRSFNRMQKINTHHRRHHHQPQQQPEPDIVNSVGEYFMKFSVGTPPVPQLGTADTGSDLTWAQCQPCFNCFNQTLPFFVPRNSPTFRPVRCHSPQCLSFPGTTSCSINGKFCRYSQTYGDGSRSVGMLATETITLGPSVSIPRFVFGCGFSNEDKFSSGLRSGIVGLGNGKGSFVRQLGPLAQGRFSYCLVSLSDASNSSKLNFGGRGLMSGGGVISTTPMATKDFETFYILTLEGISVGNCRIDSLEPALASNSADSREGNMIIDSGTTLTMLPRRLYEAVENAVKSSVKLEAAEDPLGVLRVCYLWREDAGFPDVTVHFRGADVRLETENVFVRTSEETVCLAVVPAVEDGVAIYGNLAQVNFLVGYDLVKKTVSFKRANCGKQ